MTYLTRPERDEGTEGEPGFSRGSPHLGEGGAGRDREGTRNAGLDLDLGHLPRAKGHIGEKLSRGGTGQPDETLVLVARLLTGEVHVGIFEDFVETIFEGTLEGVSNQGRSEAFPSTHHALFGNDGSETRNETLVFCGVDLRRAKKGDRSRPTRNLDSGEARTCMLHLVTSRGVIPAWVVPQAKIPPNKHLP